MNVLVLNAGSSSLKASLVDSGSGETLERADVRVGDDATRRRGWAQLVDAALESVPVHSIEAVGHRVVHGGARFRAATRVDDAVLDTIDDLADLAPLHNPVAAATIRAARARLAAVPHVACFDTAFHAGLPEAEFRYPVPEGWYRDWGVRRFGFHGLSVEWSVRRTVELLGRPPASLRLVVAHLGSGCSVTAVDGGRSAATSMGMTPLEGLMMGTRAGSIDPAIPLALLRDGRVSTEELAAALDHGSGLLAVAGTADMRTIEAAASAGDERATLALDMFVRRAAAGVAAAATALPSLDAIAFTAGIGEHAAGVRAAIVGRLGVLGVAPIASAHVSEDAVLSAPGAPVAVLRIEAREDLVIAGQTATALGERPAS
ncbi:MAG: acetate/propionate family kinase [Chloroflexi bacterium]|nr:acetate/propionate family kinase [Chloroflexota bacterium]